MFVLSERPNEKEKTMANMLDKLNIRHSTSTGEDGNTTISVNLTDLTVHFTSVFDRFTNATDNELAPQNSNEEAYLSGVIDGMRNFILFLSSAGLDVLGVSLDDFGL